MSYFSNFGMMPQKTHSLAQGPSHLATPFIVGAQRSQGFSPRGPARGPRIARKSEAKPALENPAAARSAGKFSIVAAAVVVMTARGVAGGLLSFVLAPRRVARCCTGAGSIWAFLAFFRGQCEPRTPGVGRVDLWVGGMGLCSEIIARSKNARHILFLSAWGSLARLEPLPMTPRGDV